MKIHVGTSGYGYKEWKGVFYPEKISSKDMLRFYSERLGSVEINYTFYHMPTERVLSAWAEQVPNDFAFAFKAPRIITHRKRLRNTDEETDYFFKTLSVLGRKMGPVLFQFPGSFRADRLLLENFLVLLPPEKLCAFEFRNPSWMDPAVFDLLRKKGCSLCIADTDENPVNEIIDTADWGYLRLRRSEYPEADLAQWREKILSQKWRKAFVFFKHEEEAKGPEMAIHFNEHIGAKEKTGKNTKGAMKAGAGESPKAA